MKKNNAGRIVLIVLICVITLLLAGELVLVCLNPGGSGLKFEEESALPGVREDFPFPDGQADFTLPDAGNRSGEGMPMARPSGRPSPSAGGGAAAVLRGAWIPIVLSLVVLDGICAALLLRKKRKQMPQPPQQPDMPELEVDSLPRMNRKANWVTAIAVLLTLALILSALPKGGSDTQTKVNTRVLSAGLEEASISTVLSGTGTLTASEAETVEIPDCVCVENYHVRNGDTVSPGDILASVSQVETASAIARLQSLLEELDKDLNTQKNKTGDTSVNAPVSGRVKAIYGEVGDSAAQVIYDNGALMLLSLDGLMAVDIPAGTLKAADAVTVLLSDGTEQSGRVSQILDGTATVTTSDKTAPFGDPVTVTDGTGNTLGTGTLCIHSQLKITGFSGTVAGIQTALNRQVNAGTKLITLKDTGPDFEYYRLLARRQELEQTMLSLVKLNRDGFLRAERAGQVSGIPEDADYASLTASGSAMTASGLTARDTVRVTLLSGVLEEKPEQDPGSGSVTYAASVTAISGSAMILNITANPVDLTVMDAGTALSLLPTQAITYTCDGTVPITDETGSTLTAADLLAGDVLVLTVVMDDDGTVGIVSIRRVASSGVPDDPTHGGQKPEAGNPDTALPDDIAGSGGITIPGGVTVPGGISIPGGFGGFSGSGNAQSSQKDYDTYSTECTQVLMITSMEEMTVSIRVDELDILSLETGLEAQITLDALEGQAFTGTVTSISQQGENQGGNTKFPVEVTLSRQGGMLPGMNASVKITTAVSEPVMTLPACALVEDGGRTCVYLGYDEKKDQLTDLTQVQTGRSDADRVEILSGVPEGGTVYYRYADTVVYGFVNG